MRNDLRSWGAKPAAGLVAGLALLAVGTPALAAFGFKGTGAPYMEASAKAMAGARTMHVKATVTTTETPPKGLPHTSVAVLEIAWAPTVRFFSAGTGPAGRTLSVGNGVVGYLYNGPGRRYVKVPKEDFRYGVSTTQSQLAMLLGGGPREWTYGGRQVIDGRSTTRVDGAVGKESHTLFLDAASHLPRRVIIQGQGPGGPFRYVVDFTLLRVNQPVPSSLFNFTPPAGTKVIDPSKARSH